MQRFKAQLPIVAAVFATLSLVVALAAGPGSPRRSCYDAPETPLGHEALSVDADATPETMTVPAGACWARIQPIDGNIRWEDAGTTGIPSTTAGARIYSGDVEWYRGNLDTWEACSEAGTVTVEILYYGP